MTTTVAPPLAGDALHAIENLPMTAMHAVEVAESEHRLRPPHRALVVGEMNDVHFYTAPRHKDAWPHDGGG